MNDCSGIDFIKYVSKEFRSLMNGAMDDVPQILSMEKAQRMSEFFSVLGDANRWRILSALAIEPMKVGDLAAMVAMSESAVSHQLRVLRGMRLVSYVKQGRNAIYRLKDHHILNLYREISAHLDEPDEDVME
jgi:ArsR family transcriptional regulator, lead/cadmium/zinc/bismuth-responsive transcriptional repressor